MQNIPFLEDMNFQQNVPNLSKKVKGNAATEFSKLIDKQTESQTTEADLDKAKRDELFDEIFEQHDNLMGKELATAPVSTDSQMHETAPEAASLSEPESTELFKPAETTVEDKPEDHAEDVRMTTEDLDEMRDDLKEYGLSDSEIEEIEEQINSEDGLTWGEFTQQLENKIKESKEVELSAEQQQGLASFLGKLGFTEQESSKLVNQFMNGEGDKAMKSIAEKLEALPENKKLMFTKSEVESFASAVNASEEFTTEIKKLLGKEALPKDVKEAFSMIRQNMAETESKEEKLTKSVGKALTKALGKEVRESSAAADTGQHVDLKERVASDAQTSHANTDARETAQGNTSGQQHQTESRHAGTNGEAQQNDHETSSKNKKSSAQAADKQTTSQNAQSQQSSQNTNSNNSNTNQQQFAQGQTQAQQNAKRKDWSNQPFIDEDGTEQESARKSFLSKLRSDDSSASSVGRETTQNVKTKTSETVKGLLAEQTNLAHSEKGKESSAWEKISSSKVMKQVTDATLKNLGQGKNQLTLNLKPEELGAVRVILQVDGKEVNATLRAENADAAKVISENLETLKQSLENQGLKVHKLDVQTGLSDNSSQQNWQGEQQHNLAREREAMSRMRERMRNLRAVNGNLAHNVQNMNRSANSAEQGLHVIA